MSFIDHVKACNTYRPDRFLPLRRGADRIGVFRVGHEAVELVAGGGFDALTAAVDDVVEALAAEGLVEKWRHESFAVAPRWQAPPLFKLDRGALAFFGVTAQGVHLNGWRRDAGGLRLWIGRRAPDKKVAPGKLDNLVAGGIGFGHGIFETLAKEAAEEAAMERALIERAIPVGAITYRMETRQGLRDDVLFVYDLETPAAFLPRNTDGEISEFRLMPAEEVVERIRTGDDFKFNVNLVILDFALRHGVITPDEPEYLALVTGLRRPLD